MRGRDGFVWQEAAEALDSTLDSLYNELETVGMALGAPPLLALPGNGENCAWHEPGGA